MRSGAPLTFVFTDLVSSTELLDRVGADEFDTLRRRHFSLLRDATEAHGGREVKNLGDGLMLAFESPLDALAAAVDMQRAVARQDATVGLRIGLAVGAATLDEGDYFGVPVVVAKRLCDRADGGTILASDLVAALTAGSSFRFRDLGALDLKGLSEPVPSREVLWEPSGHRPVPLPPALAGGDRVALVGRQAELERLEALIGASSVVAVTGEPGIGKTRLLAAFAAAAHASGASVLFGRCFEEALVPYRPFAEALGQYVASCPVDELRAQIGRHGGELARLVPDLRERLPGVDEAPLDEPEGERLRLFEGTRHLLARAAATRPLVLALDDVHWADGATLALLAHLAAAPMPERMLVVVAFRDAEGGPGTPLGDVLGTLHRDRPVERVALTGLGRADLGEMVRDHAGGEVADGLVAALHEETEGNPFFAGEVVRHLAESGGLVRADASDLLGGGIPDGVREVIARRVGALGPDAERVLAVAAVLGREFRPGRVGAHPETAGADVARALERAIAARLVEEAPGRPGRYRFAHALVRDTIYRGLAAPRRARLHRDAAEELEARTAGADGPSLPELAHHYFEAAVLGDESRAVEYAVRAGDWATHQVAYEEAAAHYRRALAALERSDYPDLARRCDLLLQTGDALWRSAAADAAREAFREAVAAAEALGDPERLGRAALGLVGPFNTAGAPDAEHVRAIERALALLGEEPSALRASLLGRLCDLLAYVEGLERRTALGREAVEMARATGDREALAHVLHSTHVSTWDPDGLADRRRAVAEMTRLEEQGATGLAGYGHTWRLASALEHGDRETVDRVLAEQAAAAEHLRRPSEIWQVAVHRGMVALLEGRLDEVEPCATTAFGLAPDVNNAVQIYGVQLLFLRREQARLDEMLDLVRDYARQNPELIAWRCAHGWIGAEVGRPDDAREVLEDLISDDLARVPRDNLFVCALMALADIALALEDAAAAECLRGHLAPYAGQAVLVAPVAVCNGAAARPLANMHALAGDGAATDRAFAAAIEINSRLRAAPALGHTQVEWAGALARRGEHDRAAELARAAAETATRLELPALAARCDALVLRPSSPAG